MSATSSADGQSVITNIAATINGSSVQSSAPNDTTQTVPNNPATTTTINASSSTTSAANPNPSATTTTVAPPPVNTNKIDPVLGQSKDAQTMISVLKDMGIDEYEPKIVNQLLEFSYSKLTSQACSFENLPNCAVSYLHLLSRTSIRIFDKFAR